MYVRSILQVKMIEMEILAFLLPFVFSSTWAGYPFTYPNDECSSMKPSSLQNRPNYIDLYNQPFTLEVSDTIYGLTHHVKVTVKKKESKPILGLFIQARLTDCGNRTDSRPHGEFELLAGDGRLEFVNCDGGQKNGVVNKNYGSPHDRIEVNFAVDPEEKRRIHFVATVVSLGNEVWMGVTSETIRHVSDPPHGRRHIHCPSKSSHKENKMISKRRRRPRSHASSDAVKLTFTNTFLVMYLILLKFLWNVEQ